MREYDFLESKIGKIMIVTEDKHIIILSILNKIKSNEFDTSGMVQKENDLIKECKKQLTQYFNGVRQEFDLPITLKGTEFQKKVWKALLEIPYGQTRSYKDIAVAIGNDKASRAVGMANNRNNICIIIPCHRVIGANGSLVGYGCGIDVKEKLLDLESNNKFSEKRSTPKRSKTKKKKEFSDEEIHIKNPHPRRYRIISNTKNDDIDSIPQALGQKKDNGGDK